LWSQAAELGLLKPLQALSFDEDKLRTAIAAAVAYGQVNRAASLEP